MRRYNSVFNAARRGGPNLRIVHDGANVEATVLIYDIIDFFGVNAEEFVTKLQKLDVNTIHARINSPGGNVFDGVAIANALRNHSAKVIVHIDGLAASIASVIAMAGDDVHIAPNAFFMIHDPWTITLGNSRDLRKTADVLDKIGVGIKGDYIRRIGDKHAEQVGTWMAEETWFSAQETVNAGFADSVETIDEETQTDATAASSRYDLSDVFKHAPAALLARDVRRKPTVRDLEAALRDAGCSSSEAKEILSQGHATARDTRDAERELVDAGERLLQVFQR